MTPSSNTLRTSYFDFYSELTAIIKPRNQSDRTCFRRIAGWVDLKIRSGQMPEDRAFDWVLELAREAVQPGVKNPAALFVWLVTNELGYDAKQYIIDRGQDSSR